MRPKPPFQVPTGHLLTLCSGRGHSSGCQRARNKRIQTPSLWTGTSGGSSSPSCTCLAYCPGLLFHPMEKRFRLQVRTTLHVSPWSPFHTDQGLWLPPSATPSSWMASLAMQITQPTLQLRRSVTSSPHNPGLNCISATSWTACYISFLLLHLIFVLHLLRITPLPLL